MRTFPASNSDRTSGLTRLSRVVFWAGALFGLAAILLGTGAFLASIHRETWRDDPVVDGPWNAYRDQAGGVGPVDSPPPPEVFAFGVCAHLEPLFWIGFGVLAIGAARAILYIVSDE